MANTPTIDELSREELIVIVREQQLQIAALGKLIEQLKRKKSRQASPFSKEKPVPNPKRPGRKKGEGNLPPRCLVWVRKAKLNDENRLTEVPELMVSRIA